MEYLQLDIEKSVYDACAGKLTYFVYYHRVHPIIYDSSNLPSFNSRLRIKKRTLYAPPSRIPI